MSTHSFSRQQKKIITLAALGGMLEFYDFIIYGVFSIYFAHQFFPSHNDLIIVFQSYLVFVLGYIARPIGGIIFSHIGDEYGRKKVLIITIILMGAASLGIGFLPTYSKIGMAAPLLLLSLRLIQGLALGGELPSTYVYISETIAEKRGIAFGTTMSGVNGGLLLGMLINYILNYLLTTQQLVDFGWRLPFIIGGFLCVISYRIRKTLHETAAFKRVHDKPKLPLVYLFRHHFIEVLAGIAIVSVMSGLVVVTIIFMPTYLHGILKLDNQNISYMMTALMIANVFTIYFSGRIAQNTRPFTVLKVLLVLCCFLIPLGYLLISSTYLTVGLIILGSLQGIAAMITPYVITCIFESKICLTGVALCYNVGFTLFGGLAPLIITNIIKAGYNVYQTPSIYLLIMVLICAIGTYYLSLVQSKRKKTGENRVYAEKIDHS
jgi:MFS family permease